MKIKILTGDKLKNLKTLPTRSVQCVVTSLPYYGLRAYGMDGQVRYPDLAQAGAGGHK